MHSPAPEIGGYFPLEPNSRQPRNEAEHLGVQPVRLNSGRNCLRAVLATGAYRRLHLPDYICATMVQAVRDAEVEPVFHHLDENLRPTVEIQTADDELWLGVNYFGLMNSAVAEDCSRTPRYVVDNCQAFFAPPINGAITIYSPRKFFGVPDGGYLIGADKGSWAPDDSRDRLEHMHLREKLGAEAGYSAFQNHENMFGKLPVRAMSALTQTLLATVDYSAAAQRRLENFRLLNDELGGENDLALATEFDGNGVPLAYPLLSNSEDLRSELNRHGIYAAGYWPDCLQRSECGPRARNLAQDLVALPIDQRYGPQEMAQIIRAVHGHMAGNRVRMVLS